MESVADLEREALAAAAAAPSDPVAGPGANPGQPVSSPAITGPTEEEIFAGYDMICTEVIDSGFTAIAPAWQVTRPEVSKLSAACSRALMLWFPDMIIPPKYLALLTVAGVGFEIVQARRDPNTGQLRPRHLPEQAPGNSQAATPAAH